MQEFTETVTVLDAHYRDELNAKDADIQTLKTEVQSLKEELEKLRTMHIIHCDERRNAITVLMGESPWIDEHEVKWREQRAYRQATDNDDYLSRLDAIDSRFQKKKKRKWSCT